MAHIIKQGKNIFDYGLHGIENSGVSCYANSVIQCLFSLPLFCNIVENTDEGQDEIVNKLKKFLIPPNLSNHMTSDDIRHSVGENFKSNIQQDCVEFFNQILMNTHIEEIRSLFGITETVSCRCNKCNTLITKKDLKYMWFGRSYNGDIVFKDLFPSWRIDKIRCNQCMNISDRRVEISGEFPPHTQYMVVVLPLHEYNNRKQSMYTQRKIKGFNANECSIFSYKFRTLAAVEHIGPTAYSGHYTSWIKKKSDWIHIDDVKMSGLRKRFVSNVENIYMLFLEKV